VTAIKPGREVLRRANRPNLRALKATVKLRGMFAVDRRTHVARGLLAWKNAILNDLGGASEVSAARMGLVDMACRTRLLIEHCDAWMMEQKNLIDEKEKKLLPIVLERQKLVDSLGKLLVHVGLKKQARKVLSLQEYWNRPVTETEANGDEESGAEAKDDSGRDERSGVVPENIS
jgi:hypothetical protein